MFSIKVPRIILRLLSPLFLCLIVTGCLKDYTDPEVVAYDYVDAVYSGSVGLFKKVVEEKHQRKTSDHQLFVDKESSGKFSTGVRRDGVKEIKVTDSRVGKTHATVKVEVTFGDKTQKRLRIPLHLVKDRWYVDPMTWGSW